MNGPLPGNGQLRTVPPLPEHRVSRRRGGHLHSLPASEAPPDLAAVARTAVIGFLRDESAATTERDNTQGGGPAPDAPQAVAMRAAAMSVATLERIELAAAKLEIDIAAARTEQAELQAGAGVAAERAVRAAQEAWTAAAEAEASSGRAKESLRRIGHYMAITVVLVVLELLIAVAFAASAH